MTRLSAAVDITAPGEERPGNTTAFFRESMEGKKRGTGIENGPQAPALNSPLLM